MSEERPAEPDPIRFEEALARLETLVAALESGELELEDALRDFEEGVGLVRVCSQKLKAAELRIKQLEETVDGPRERALDPEGSA